jgi:hypothetical protein
MRTCRYIKNNGDYSIPLEKNKIYHYFISYQIMNSTLLQKYNHYLYKFDTNELLDIFSVNEFDYYFIDIQKERKQKLKNLYVSNL